VVTTWLTDKSFCDRLPRPALKVRANSSKSSQEDCKGLSTRFNGFETVSPAFNHGRVSNGAISLSGLLSVNRGDGSNLVTFLYLPRLQVRMSLLAVDA